MHYDPGSGNYIVIDGMLVERDALRIAEAVQEYDPDLFVMCVDPNQAGISEEPFVVVHIGKDGVARPVMRAWKLDDLLLERIKMADSQRFNTLRTLEEMEASAKKENENRYRETMMESHDISAHVLASRKSKYTVRHPQTGALVTFYDDRPAKVS